MKGLAEKFRARPTPMNPSLLSTASDDRRDPAIALDLMSRVGSVSLATKRCDEPRRQHWPDSRERPYEFVVRVFTSKRINFVIVDSSSSDKLLQQTGPRHNGGTAGGKDRHIGSRSNGLPNLLQNGSRCFRLCDYCGRSRSVSIVAGLARCSLS